MIDYIIGLLPNAIPFPEVVGTAFSTFGGYLSLISPIVPISTMATILGLVITIELTLFAFRTVKWIASFIPVIGGRG